MKNLLSRLHFLRFEVQARYVVWASARRHRIPRKLRGTVYAQIGTAAAPVRQPGQIGQVSAQTTSAEVSAIKRDLSGRLQRLVQAVGGNQGSELVVRDLVPNDIFVLGVQTLARFFNGIALSANAWTTDVFSGVNNALPQSKALGIYGIGNLSPSPQVDQVRFYLGTSPISQVFLDPLYLDAREAFLYFNPVLWGPQEVARVDMLSNVAVGSGAENITFLGLVAETAGTTFTPRHGI